MSVERPTQVRRSLLEWIRAVELDGLEKVRRVPGFHDEPLRGNRHGQRSIRLNRQWRAIYELRGEEIRIALVLEVTPHKY